jgi:hypothetical protein
MDSHQSAIIPPDNVMEPLPGAVAMETGKVKRHSKMKTESSIDTKRNHHKKKKSKDKPLVTTKDIKSEQNMHHKMAKVKLAQEDIQPPSVVEPPALQQESEVVDAKPPSSKKLKKKKKKGNDCDGNNGDDIHAREEPAVSTPVASADASMPIIVAHLIGEDEINAETEERIREEERERIRQEGIWQRNMVEDYQQRYLQRDIQAGQVDMQQGTFCNKPVSRRRQLLIYSLIFVTVMAIIAITLVFTLKEPEPKSSLSLVCQETCKGLLTGTPVTVNGEEFQKAISEYLKDPSSSPYGSVINCWDVSQVSFYPYIIWGCFTTILFF